MSEWNETSVSFRVSPGESIHVRTPRQIRDEKRWTNRDLWIMCGHSVTLGMWLTLLACMLGDACA